MAEFENLDDALFSYAVGTLDPATRARVEAALDADPALRQRLRWYEAVCEQVVDALPPLPSLPAADLIVAQARVARPAQRAAASTGFFAWLAGPALRPAAFVAAALIVVQAAMIAGLLGERETEAVRALAPGDKAAVFVIAFDPDTTEADIRSLLLKAGASIIDGPRQLGDYRVSVPANRAEYARSLFEESGIAEYVRAEELPK
jgi:anti-sigma factor RsiW